MGKLLKKEKIGSSAKGLAIEALQLTQGPIPVLILGGVHGDEPEGFFLVEKWLNTETCWTQFQGRASLWLLPRVNPDGCSRNERGNGAGVDLNRNMPTKDWTNVAAQPRYFPGPAAASEPETRALMELINRLNPKLIISAHSWNPMINYNGPCKKLAEHMSKFNGYKVSDDIGYPTPGSLGTWAGWERKLPVITLEIERGSSEDLIWKTHAQALSEAVEFAITNERLD